MVHLGMIGLGRMGANMAERLVAGGHQVVGYDRDPHALGRAASRGAKAADSVQAPVSQLTPPRAVWIMVPAGGPVDGTINDLIPLLAQGDAVIDGGNSNYKDTVRRAVTLEQHGIHLVDVGTSGGVWGLR